MEDTNWAQHERQFGPVNWEILAQHLVQTLTDTFKVHRTWGQIAHTTTESEPKIHISLLARAFNYKTMPASHPGYNIVASSGPDVENPHGMLQRALARFVRENGGPGETTFTPPGGQKTSFRFVRVDNPSLDVIQYGVVTPDNSPSSGSQSSSRPGSSSGGRPGSRRGSVSHAQDHPQPLSRSGSRGPSQADPQVGPSKRGRSSSSSGGSGGSKGKGKMFGGFLGKKAKKEDER